MKKIKSLFIVFCLYSSLFAQSQASPNFRFTPKTSYLFTIKSNNSFIYTNYYQLMNYGSETNKSSLEKYFYENQHYKYPFRFSVPFLAIFSPGINYDPDFYSKTSGFDTGKLNNIILMRAVASIHFQMKIKK